MLIIKYIEVENNLHGLRQSGVFAFESPVQNLKLINKGKLFLFVELLLSRCFQHGNLDH